MRRTLCALLLLAGFASASPAASKHFYDGAHAAPIEHRTADLAAIYDPGMGSGQTGSGHGVTLSWVASSSAAGCTTPCQFGYNVFRGTAAGAESSTPINSTLLTALTYFDPVTLTSAVQTFFYYVEAVEISSGVTANSTPSNEVSASFPGIPSPAQTLVATPK